MIDPRYWQTAILSYAEFLLDNRELTRAWVEGDTSATSVTEFYELYEQIFDDLDSDNMVKGGGISSSLRPFIEKFLNEIKYVDDCIESDVSLKCPSVLLASDSWKRLILASNGLLEAAKELD